MEVLITVSVLCAVVGGAIGSSKGLGFAGMMLGLLLGPLGVVVIAVMKGSTLGKIQTKPATEGWYDDPLGRFDGRYYDGKRWTQHVGRIASDGTRLQLEDPV